MTKLFPLIFVFLWSSAFITGKVVVFSSSPFAALSFRFLIVAFGFYCISLLYKNKIVAKLSSISKSFITGFFFHGIYLGGVWYAYSQNINVGIIAIIICLQPILTGIFAGPLLNEKINFKQWLGLSLGLIGSIFVIGIDFGESISVLGIISSLIALFGITAGTLIEKKYKNDLSLSVNNMYQAISASLFHLFLTTFFEESYINFTLDFILALSWQIIVISFGAFSILIYLIKVGSASKTASLFFLIPPVTAIMAWIFFKENLETIDVAGFVIAAIGVFIATNSKKLDTKTPE
tara:strand:- start:113 stop:988 length:876 start_codon:yes stop_codon:yes gene_type:complete